MEERSLKYVALYSALFFIGILDPANAQRSKRNRTMDNVSQYRLVSFSRPISKDSIKVTAFLEIPFNSLQFIKRNNDFLAFYDATITLQGADGKQLLRETWSDSIVATYYVHTQSRLRTKKHHINFNIDKEKYVILSELYDKDTRKKGSKKKKLNFTKTKKVPSLMEPIILTDLKGEWGFESNEFPIIGKKISNIDAGFVINIVGFANEGPYTIRTIIKSNTEDKELPIIEGENSGGFFSHRLQIDKAHLQSISLKIEIELRQSNQVKKIEKNISIYKPGVSGYVDNIENSFRQMKYILTSKERNNAKGKKGKELETIFLQYWIERDPTPKTSLNELMEEYYIRVNYVNEYFNMSWREGWETDFGMIYILFGPPDEIQRTNPSGTTTSIYQVWYYNSISKQFTFKDQNGFGDYRLDTPFIGPSY